MSDYERKVGSNRKLEVDEFIQVLEKKVKVTKRAWKGKLYRSLSPINQDKNLGAQRSSFADAFFFVESPDPINYFFRFSSTTFFDKVAKQAIVKIRADSHSCYSKKKAKKNNMLGWIQLNIYLPEQVLFVVMRQISCSIS